MSYKAVKFPETGAVAVCDLLDIQNTSDQVYAFSVNRKATRCFERRIWNSAIKLDHRQTSEAVIMYQRWESDVGRDDENHKERLKHRLAMLEGRKNIINEYFHAHGVKHLWHMTHKDNVGGIIEKGILNHYDAHSDNFKPFDISDHNAQRWREYIEPRYSRRIHEYAPLYINPRNPMLFVRREIQRDICLIAVSLDVMVEYEFLVTDGNAASRGTLFGNTLDDLNLIPWDVLNGNFWDDYEDGKRKKCAEVLIHPKVSPKYINQVHCYSPQTCDLISGLGLRVYLTPKLFF